MTPILLCGELSAQQTKRDEATLENRTTGGALIALLPTISRTLSLSFQSSFHRSLMVLVCYRSLANVQLEMDITTHLVLQSRATRLNEGVSGCGCRRISDGAMTLCDPLSQQRVLPDSPQNRHFRIQRSERKARCLPR